MPKRYPSGIISANVANLNAGIFSATQQLVSNPSLLNILVIGGGAGGGSGGGGAGGYAETTVPFAKGTYTIIVGAGGLGWNNTVSTGRKPTGGSDSILQYGNTANLTSKVTAFGGGRGETIYGNYPETVSSGGSGGGSALGPSGGTNPGGAGVTNQGNSGGSGAYGGGNGAGGGGGGAGSAGVNNTSNSTSNGTNGGAGKLFTLLNITLAGGGGGAGYASGPGTGGAGGGGNARIGNQASNADSGTINTGGGGGAKGASPPAGYTAGSGGSGVVYVWYPLSFKQATTVVGTHTYSVVSQNHLYTFTSSGSITF